MLFIVVSICLIASQASGQDAGIYSNRSDIVRGGDNPVLQISNVLGVKTEVDAYSLYVNNDLLNYLTQNEQDYRTHSLLLKISDGAYISIPLSKFKEANADENGLQTVILSNGYSLKGWLLSSVKTSDSKVYDLNTTRNVKLISLPSDWNDIPSLNNTETWKASISAPVRETYNVKKPLFGFQYYSTEGYYIGGTDVETTSDNFYIRVNGSDVLTQLSDFQTIDFLGGDDVKIVAPDGTETEGSITPASNDGEKCRWTWYLTMYIDNNGLGLILLKPICTLSRLE